jgi:pimeloyl-ACP methyl ester carboxylesterase
MARRLQDFDVLAYDRRGYQGSLEVGAAADLSTHAEDLLDAVALVADRGPVTILGHSLGGVIAIAAALRAPGSIAGLIAYETPMRWLIDDGPDWWEPAEDPSWEAERFFRRITSDAAWEHLGETERASRRTDGAALAADLRMIRDPRPFEAKDLEQLELPLCLALGTGSDQVRYSKAAEIVSAHAPHAWLADVTGAQHGAHLTHPDALAALVRDVALRQASTRLSA